MAREHAGNVLNKTPAPILFLTAGFSQYFGAAVGIGLFSLASPHVVAWLRSVVAGVIILAIVRPWRLQWTRRALAESALFGVVLLSMNMAAYVAFNYLPLGAAVTLEFVGPILLSATRSANIRGRLAALLAFVGVVLISILGLEWDVTNSTDLTIGLVAITVASGAWTAYMYLGSKIAGQRSGQASLAVGMVAAAIIYAPVTAPWAGGLLSLKAGALVIAMGVLTSVVPYMLDQVTIRRLDMATFALLNALLPASATLVGLLALRQIPSLAEILGLLAITLAVALANRPASGPRPQAE